jgi:hypothetical protein
VTFNGVSVWFGTLSQYAVFGHAPIQMYADERKSSSFQQFASNSASLMGKLDWEQFAGLKSKPLTRSG